MASARPWKAMLTTAAKASVMLYLPLEGGGRPRERSERGRVGVIGSAQAMSFVYHPTPLASASLRRATLPLQGRVDHFGGFNSFHGSFTFGIVSNSTLASLPSFI